MKRGVSKYPELAGLTGQDYIAAWHRMKCCANQARNLTKRGTPRRYRVAQRLDDLRGLPKREYDRLRANRLRARRREQPSLMELDWKLFRELESL